MLFSLPVGTEMFHFPTFPPHALYIQARVTTHHCGWVSPFGHPRISARLTAPRGLSQPPTSFIGSWCQGIHRTLLNTYNKDARVHCAVLKQHTNRKPVQTPDQPELPFPLRYDLRFPLVVSSFEKITRVFPQDPTVRRYIVRRRSCDHPIRGRGSQCSTHEHHRITCESEVALPSHAPRLFGVCGEMLLRKEVIQPHLPVRLPCYDFVPIADPTFDGSLPRGVRPPASGVTDFHDVTGGVYKARERIHRSVADLRLLATPTSRGRVADPDPN